MTTKYIFNLLPPIKFVLKNKWIGLCFVVFFFTFSLKSQTIFWTETFDGTACLATSGCDPSMVSWPTTVTGAEGASANKFYVSCQENGNAAGACGAGCGADQSLHLGNISTSAAAFLWCPLGDCGASYDASGATELTSKRCESPIINCTGRSTITINFNYIESGQTTLDDATLWYFNGTVWAQIDNMPKSVNGVCAPQGRWTARLVSLPASANNNAGVKIGFRWVNNGDGTGSDPSFAVDDVTASYLTTLPIELLSFKGIKEGKLNRLEWTTASESNNDYFTVERSYDGAKFKEVAKINGAGNSTQNINYTMLDELSPLTELTYYRLKQTDFNGEYSFSEIISLETEQTDFKIVNIFNSTEQNILEVTLNCENTATLTFELFDITGKKVFFSSRNVPDSNMKITISTINLKTSIYLFKANDGNQLITRKIKI